MALINRIQISCYHDPANWLSTGQGSRTEWRPQFVDTTLDFATRNSVVAARNGTGKTSILFAVFAILSRDRKMTEWATNKMAPKEFGYYSHIRIEICVRETSAQEDLIGKSGPDVPGIKYVLGMYGNFGSSQKDRGVDFYYYRGTLDKCPVATRHEGKITPVSNKDFRARLAEVVADGGGDRVTEDSWNSVIDNFFQRDLIKQLVKYQRGGGGEGGDNLLYVKPRSGEAYDAAMFYQIVAPELLVDVMGSEALEGEERFEHTVAESVKKIFTAQRNKAKKEAYFEEHGRALEDLNGASAAAGELLAATETVASKKMELLSAYKTVGVFVQSPIPGMPPLVPPSDPLARRIAEKGFIVLQDNDIFVLDRGVALFSGEETRAVNQRADRKGIANVTAEIMQLLDIVCDCGLSTIGRPQSGGSKNRLYSCDQAVELVALAPKFADDWTKETAIGALKAAFDHAETNNFRREARRLAQEISYFEGKEKDLKKEKAELNVSLQNKIEELYRFAESRAAFEKMKASGVFSDEDLTAPIKCKERIEKRISDIQEEEKVVGEAILKLRRGKEALESFRSSQGGSSDPAEYVRDQAQLKACLKDSLKQTEALRDGLNEEIRSAGMAAIEAEKRESELRQRQAQMGAIVASVERYKAVFGEEAPDGLAQSVTSAFNRGQGDLRTVQTELSGLSGKLDALRAFRADWPGLSPQEWLDRHQTHRDGLQAKLRDLKDDRTRIARQKKHADEDNVAPSDDIDEVLKELAPEGTPTLYQAVRGMSLSKDRERELLTVFSSLLFCPVCSGPGEGIELVRRIDEKQLECPVFVAGDLASFCSGTTITVKDDGAHALFAGAATENVLSILDPARIEERRHQLTHRLEEHDWNIESIQKTLDQATSSPEITRSLQRAHQAAQAISENAENREIELLKRQSELTEAVKNAQARFEAKNLIEAMSTYLKLGGTKEQIRIAEGLVAISEEKETLASRQQHLDEEISKAKTAVDRIKSEIDERDSAQEIEALAKESVVFLTDFGGETGLKQAEERRTTLGRTLREAVAQMHFDFEGAEGFVTFGKDEAARLESEREVISQMICAKEGEEDKCKLLLDDGRNKIDGIRDKSRALNERVVSILRSYRNARQAVIGRELDTADTSAQPQQRAVALAELLSEWRSPEEVLEAASEAAALAEHIEPVVLAAHFDHAVEDERKAKEHYSHSIDRALALKSSAISDVARQKLVEAKVDPKIMQGIYAQFSRAFEEAKESFEKAGELLAEKRSTVSSDLSDLAMRLMRNFDLCRKTLRPSAQGEAGFYIDAKKRSESSLTDVIENIIRYLEKRFLGRYDDTSKSFNLEPEEHVEFVDYIRDSFYRSMFMTPSIKVQFPGICGDKQFPFPVLNAKQPTVSKGQLQALQLLWAVKFGDFAIERDLDSFVPDNRKSKKKQFARERVYLIDGIFSDLSDPDCINLALSCLRKNQGRFQLIGFNHNVSQATDFSLFQARVTLRKKGAGFIAVDHVYEGDSLVIPLHVNEDIVPKKKGRN